MPGVSNAGNTTVGSGERHGDGNDDDAGSGISLLLMPIILQRTFELESAE